MATPTYLSHLGLIKEVTLGTYVAPGGAGGLYIPMASAPKVSDVIETVLDQSIDANNSLVRGAYQGLKTSTFAFDTYLYPELTFLLFSGLGLTDTITGAGPYTHTGKIPSAGTQPNSYSATLFNGFEARGFPGLMWDQLKMTVGTNGIVSTTSSLNGWASANQSTPTPAFPTSTPFMAWHNQLSIGGTPSTRLLSGDMTFKRNANTIPTLAATQNPHTTFAGTIDVVGTAKLLFEASNADYLNYLSNLQPAMVWTMTQGANPVLTINFGKTSWTKTDQDFSAEYLMLDVTFSGIYNATDQGPFSITLLDSHSTAY